MPLTRYLIGKQSSQSLKASAGMAENIELNSIGGWCEYTLARLRLSGIFSACMMPLLLKDHLFQNLMIVIASGVKCGGPKSLPVLHHGADYIFWFFVINELMLVFK